MPLLWMHACQERLHGPQTWEAEESCCGVAALAPCCGEAEIPPGLVRRVRPALPANCLARPAGEIEDRLKERPIPPHLHQAAEAIEGFLLLVEFGELRQLMQPLSESASVASSTRPWLHQCMTCTGSP